MKPRKPKPPPDGAVPPWVTVHGPGWSEPGDGEDDAVRSVRARRRWQAAARAWLVEHERLSETEAQRRYRRLVRESRVVVGRPPHEGRP